MDREAGTCYRYMSPSTCPRSRVARDYIAGWFRRRCDRRLTVDRLTLALTEARSSGPARATRVFEALKALARPCTDTSDSYSSLAYLQRLRSILKIDRSFVAGMMIDPDSVAIVRAVLGLAEALGMSTTAEGIETVELATTLATLGCASGQGFYFAKPLEPGAALEFWRSRRR